MSAHGVARGGAGSHRRKMIFGKLNLSFKESTAVPSSEKAAAAAAASKIMGELSSAAPVAMPRTRSPQSAVTPAAAVADTEPTKVPKKRKRAPEPATDKQLAFLRKLILTRKWEPKGESSMTVGDKNFRVNPRDPKPSKAAARRVIDALMQAEELEFPREAFLDSTRYGKRYINGALEDDCNNYVRNSSLQGKTVSVYSPEKGEHVDVVLVGRIKDKKLIEHWVWEYPHEQEERLTTPQAPEKEESASHGTETGATDGDADTNKEGDSGGGENEKEVKEAPKATAKQVAFIERLMDKQVHLEGGFMSYPKTPEEIRNLSRKQASLVIESLLGNY